MAPRSDVDGHDIVPAIDELLSRITDGDVVEQEDTQQTVWEATQDRIAKE